MTRRKDLTAKRDKAIVEKFHELYDIKRMRMDDVLDKLSNELFYLDANYIYARIFYDKQNSAYYDSLVASKAQHRK